MVHKECYRVAIPGQYEVALRQAGADNFTVVYGMQIKANLSYNDAAREFGAAIMHALACNGKLDNREPPRARARRAGA